MLTHLTGPRRGHVDWLSLPAHRVRARSQDRIAVLPADEGETPAEAGLALFRQAGGSYIVEGAAGGALWVNGHPVSERLLRHGDMIEFGDDRPLARFEVIDAAHPMRRTVQAITSDALAYLSASRRPIGARLLRGLSTLAVRLLRETTVLFRITVLAVLVGLGWVLLQQSREIDRMGGHLEAGSDRLDAVATALAVAREEALRPADLETLRQEVDSLVEAQRLRIKDLERRWQAAPELISYAQGSVAFLQGAYGFRQIESGRMLRLVLAPDGKTVVTRFGKPLLTLDGDGPVAERTYTGTAFLIRDARTLATNRHVALPWERDPASIAASAEGLEPVMLKLIAYFPGRTAPLSVRLDQVSDTADLALLRIENGLAELVPLEIDPRTARVGEEIIVLGYPTGLRAMLAQSGERFVQQLKDEGSMGFWEIAEGLAKARLISPLASRGIVGQARAASVAFDADTAHGGSGGPVLDQSGKVIAVQSAIVPDFGGSNLAVPAGELVDLLNLTVTEENPAGATPN